MKKILIIGLILALCIVISPVWAATLWTDKADYSPEETVNISGSGFQPFTGVTVDVLRPDGTRTDPEFWVVTSDEAGNFTTPYQLDGITGTYTITATDEVYTVVITFTDKVNTRVDTVIYNNETGLGVTGIVPPDTHVYDTATITKLDPSTHTPSGSLTYRFYSDDDCGSSDLVSSQTVTLSGGLAPNSSVTAALSPGSYGYKAVYSGDDNFTGDTSDCEPLLVRYPTSITTHVYNNTDKEEVGVNGHISLGTLVYDNATLTGYVAPYNMQLETGGGSANDEVIYSWYTNGACSGSHPDNVTVDITSDGIIPNSSTSSGSLDAGSYSYRVYYTGNNNYSASISDCEPFIVDKVSTSVTTQVINNSNMAPIALGGSIPTGSRVYDTAFVLGKVSGFSMDGNQARYTFFTNGTCSGSGTNTTVDVNFDGSLENSPTTGSLAAGSYSYRVTYRGNDNYESSVSDCEYFTVGAVSKADTTITTHIFNNTSKDEISLGSSIPLGTSVYDNATVSGKVDDVDITGNVTFRFFTNLSCTGDYIEDTDLSLGSNSSIRESLAAGMYSFNATYNGDDHYNPSTSDCENFTVEKAQLTVTTQVHNSTDDNVTATSIPLGSVVHDYAEVGGNVSGFDYPAVTFTFFTNGTCSPDGVVVDNSGPAEGGFISVTSDALPAGEYSYRASIAGNENYLGDDSDCENFTVEKADTSTITQVYNSSDDSPIGLDSHVPLATRVYDTAVVGTQVDGISITGNVTYSFFTNGSCSDDPVSTEEVELGINSTETGYLAVGSYSYQVYYEGNENYNPSTSDCENFTVDKFVTTSAVMVTPNPVQYSDLVNLTANLSPSHVDGFIPATNVSFYIGGQFVVDVGLLDENGILVGEKDLSQILNKSGSYMIWANFTGVDEANFVVSNATTTLNVTPENASCEFNVSNPLAVRVPVSGGNSGLFNLITSTNETVPDLSDGIPAPGNISLANVTMILVPVGPGGGNVKPIACTDTISGAAFNYDNAKESNCSFNNVPVNTYSVQVTIDLDGYYIGSCEDVLTVYDPTLFASGGGWFLWPGSTDRTTFGFTLKYNKKGVNPQGSVLVIRHLAAGSSFKMKSNALTDLVVSTDGWASFSGKATYSTPGMMPIGNYLFNGYAQDNNEPGSGIDQFWINVTDSAQGVTDLSMPNPGISNLINISGGNIIIPHTKSEAATKPTIKLK